MLALYGVIWGVNFDGEDYFIAPIIVFICGIALNLIGFINLWLLTKRQNKQSRAKQPWEQ
jgi:hypothetical protein